LRGRGPCSFTSCSLEGSRPSVLSWREGILRFAGPFHGEENRRRGRNPQHLNVEIEVLCSYLVLRNDVSHQERISIQVEDEDLRRAEHLEVGEDFDDAGIENPEASAGVDVDPEDGGEPVAGRAVSLEEL